MAAFDIDPASQALIAQLIASDLSTSLDLSTDIGRSSSPIGASYLDYEEPMSACERYAAESWTGEEHIKEWAEQDNSDGMQEEVVEEPAQEGSWEPPELVKDPLFDDDDDDDDDNEESDEGYSTEDEGPDGEDDVSNHDSISPEATSGSSQLPDKIATKDGETCIPWSPSRTVQDSQRWCAATRGRSVANLNPNLNSTGTAISPSSSDFPDSLEHQSPSGCQKALAIAHNDSTELLPQNTELEPSKGKGKATCEFPPLTPPLANHGKGKEPKMPDESQETTLAYNSTNLVPDWDYAKGKSSKQVRSTYKDSRDFENYSEFLEDEFLNIQYQIDQITGERIINVPFSHCNKSSTPSRRWGVNDTRDGFPNHGRSTRRDNTSSVDSVGITDIHLGEKEGDEIRVVHRSDRESRNGHYRPYWPWNPEASPESALDILLEPISTSIEMPVLDPIGTPRRSRSGTRSGSLRGSFSGSRFNSRSGSHSRSGSDTSPGSDIGAINAMHIRSNLALGAHPPNIGRYSPRPNGATSPTPTRAGLMRLPPTTFHGVIDFIHQRTLSRQQQQMDEDVTNARRAISSIGKPTFGT